MALRTSQIYIINRSLTLLPYKNDKIGGFSVIKYSERLLNKVGHLTNKYVISGPVQFKNFACQLKIDENRLSNIMTEMGCNKEEISSIVNVEIAELILDYLKIPYINKKIHQSSDIGVLRAPIVAIVGHVDHGKTTLLDYLRKASVAAHEVGGITQSISAFTVRVSQTLKVCFIDTPGHSTFQNVRSRGVQATDIVVLIISADDGVQEQTKECINLIKSAIVPFVVCVTKIDKVSSRPIKIYENLMKHGVWVTEIGGTIPCFEISAKTGKGVKEFIIGLSQQAKQLKLYNRVTDGAIGIIIDCKLRKSLGLCATSILRQGVIKRGDMVMCPSGIGRARQLISEKGKFIDHVGPSQPFGLVGWDVSPIPGEFFSKITKTENLKQIRKRFVQMRPKITEAEKIFDGPSGRLVSFGTNSMIEYDEKNPSYLNIVIKCDNYGSAEAIAKGIRSCTDKRVSINILFCGIDNISSQLLSIARSSKAIFYTFNSSFTPQNHTFIEDNQLEYKSFNIIYKLFDDIKNILMTKMKEGKMLKEIGEAEVLKIFRFTGKQATTIYGLKVSKGALLTDPGHIYVAYRGEEIVYRGEITSMKKYKTTIKHANIGEECGIGLDKCPALLPHDKIFCFKLCPNTIGIEWHY